MLEVVRSFASVLRDGSPSWRMVRVAEEDADLDDVLWEAVIFVGRMVKS